MSALNKYGKYVLLSSQSNCTYFCMLLVKKICRHFKIKNLVFIVKYFLKFSVIKTLQLQRVAVILFYNILQNFCDVTRTLEINVAVIVI